ncbi:MAG: histidine triad nucleotide-binding protein [Eubacteriales bacterium]
MNCIFCKIVDGTIPSKKVYEDDEIVAFYDVNPQAPIHIIIITKTHLNSVAEIDENNSNLIAHIFEVISKLAVELELKNGFRVLTNCGVSAGQSVEHLHLHLLSGRDFSWPPG